MSYEGWSDRLTWLVNLWIKNHDAATCAYWKAATKFALFQSANHETVKAGTWSRAQAAVFTLANRLQREIQDDCAGTEGASGGLASDLLSSDLLSSALELVDWEEIAVDLLADFLPRSTRVEFRHRLYVRLLGCANRIREDAERLEAKGEM